MELLLDTQAIYLWTIDSATLPPRAASALADGRNRVALSAASFWELSIKQASGRLQLPDEAFAELLDSSFEQLHVTPRHAIAAGRLPLYHRDPFDRMLVAQAQAENLTLVGSDPIFARYGLTTLWA